MIPQLVENGYTAVPNHFLDNVAPGLTGSELKAALYIFRHTVGWQKLSDCISYSQFLEGVCTHDGKRLDKGAGISKRSLITALAGLEAKGLITRSYIPGRPASLYTLTDACFKPVQVHMKPSQTLLEPETHNLPSRPVDPPENASQQEPSTNPQIVDKVIHIPAEPIQAGANFARQQPKTTQKVSTQNKPLQKKVNTALSSDYHNFSKYNSPKPKQSNNCVSGATRYLERLRNAGLIND